MNKVDYEHSCFHVFQDQGIDTLELMRYRNQLAKYHLYLICMTPRSGSSFLADMLFKSGHAGHPGEYFNHKLLAASLKGLANKGVEIRSLMQYMNWLLRSRSSKNRVVGIKASYFQYKPMKNLGLEEALLGKPKYIYLHRRNIVRQSVSMYLASKTQFFHSVQQHKAETTREKPDYDNDAMREWVRHIHTQEKGWAEYFEVGAKPYLNIDYDGLTSDPSGTLRRIFEHLGLDPELAVLELKSDHSKIGNSLNNEFFERFVGDPANRDYMAELGLGVERIEGR
jgi:LPS sulfotransferase NodH